MYKVVQAKVHTVTKDGTYFFVLVPQENLTEEVKKLSDNGILRGELRFDDGRTITADQRKKAWATIGDIAAHTGDLGNKAKDYAIYEELLEIVGTGKENKDFVCAWFKYQFMLETGEPPISLSDCSVTTARHFITFLLDFCLEWGVGLSEPYLHRTDDVDAMLLSALKNGRCILCGEDGERHHWDAIGMGRDRKTYDDSGHRKICLCREHHEEAHNIGRDSFAEKHHVYGIIYKD